MANFRALADGQPSAVCRLRHVTTKPPAYSFSNIRTDTMWIFTRGDRRLVGEVLALMRSLLKKENRGVRWFQTTTGSPGPTKNAAAAPFLARLIHTWIHWKINTFESGFCFFIFNKNIGIVLVLDFLRLSAIKNLYSYFIRLYRHFGCFLLVFFFS